MDLDRRLFTHSEQREVSPKSRHSRAGGAGRGQRNRWREVRAESTNKSWQRVLAKLQTRGHLAHAGTSLKEGPRQSRGRARPLCAGSFHPWFDFCLFPCPSLHHREF